MKIKYIIILLIFIISSCAGAKKKRAHRYFNENKKELAELCLERFPITPQHIKGDTIRVIDTLKIIDKIPVKIPCPDGTVVDCPPKEIKYVTVNNTVTDTLKVVDRRKEYILEEQINEMTKENKKLRSWNKKLIYVSVLLLLLFVVLRILK